MSQLTNNQENILTIAASRPDGKLEPLPSTIMGGAKTATLKSLENKGFAEQLNDDWVITTNGRKAISKESKNHVSLFDSPHQIDSPSEQQDSDDHQPSNEEPSPEPPQDPPKKKTKKALTLEMISRPEGASLEALCTATNWKKHSVRGSISQLKRKGHNIISTKVDGERSYSIGTEEPDVETSKE